MFKKMCEHSNGWRPEDGVPDLAMMSDITDQGINVNLRTRYQRDQIYTFSGSILIAVNPYKQLDIYNAQSIMRYRQQKLDQTDPHVFAVAEAMYMNLVMQDFSEHSDQANHSNSGQASSSRIAPKNQACVISGESGAGKTETTKFILSYLCSVTPNKSTWMEHQILEANTILEAFGNAKTVRNDNSSRFGKFIQICFDSHYQINGCIIQDYLLEQSRITYQSIDERNYHVFYQLLAAGQTNQELRKKFHLMPANFYDYLNKTKCYNIEGVDDCAMFDSLRMAMSVLNMEQDSCDGIFSVLSAILWLGNLQFQCDDGGLSAEQCQLTEADIEIIEIVAQLLGVERKNLEPITLRRQINVRGTITEIPFKLHEARDNRNGMAKALYSRLFTWVVNFINASTNPGLDNTCFLGVLDIFGFENFDTNSFEQLCINYTNEKLHKFFNHHMFAMEQELYQREGIEFCDINYTDNTPCLELLERPPNCILRLLSEECRIPKGSDSTFLEKLHSEFATSNPHPYYIKGSDRRNWSSEFSIKHFAGSVTYCVKGFLKKNTDAQQNQLLGIIEASSNPLLRDLVNCNGSRHRLGTSSSIESSTRLDDHRQDSMDSAHPLTISAQESKPNNLKGKLQYQQSFCSTSLISSDALDSSKMRRKSSFNFENINLTRSNSNAFTNSSSKSKPTVADAFRHQLSSLVELLNSVNPWYVRCIKPNLEKSATDYDDRQVLLQLRYLGMSDLIKIRREGYPIHLTKHQFVCRYRCLMLKHIRSSTSNSPIGLDEESLEKYCILMMNFFRLDPKDWKIGKTMVLLRASVYQPMEERRNQLFIDMATLIQSNWRGYILRRRFIRMKFAAIRIEQTFRAFRGRLLYLRKKRAVLTIQAYVRGMFAREIANALREIKRAEIERAKNLAAEQKEREQREKTRLEQEENQRKKMEENSIINESRTDIVITAVSNDDNNGSECTNEDRCTQLLDSHPGTSSPASQSNISPAVSSSTSWVGQDFNSAETKQSKTIDRDRCEMEELVKVLERHGISLDAVDQNNNAVYADFEKLYDVLGNQLQNNCDGLSLSPSVNDDDRCSFATMGTNCDGDSVSCSGQSQISSTVTDEPTCTDEKATSGQSTEQDSKNDTVNPNNDLAIYDLEENKYHSNSIESIASIVSTTSSQSQQQCQQQPQQANSPHQPTNQSENSLPIQESVIKQVFESPPRISSFTGNSIMVTGSKLVSNGRPLTRIDEEPNSTATSPSKTPHRKRADSTSRPQSLFPPEEEDESKKADTSKSNLCMENKKRRLERKILQVQQDQQYIQQPINPTTAGVPVSNQAIEDTTPDQGPSQDITNKENQNDTGIDDSIYGIQKSNIIEYAEHVFNNHLRDSTNAGGVMRTLTRRRKSVDTASSEYLSKGEMLSYNSSFAIPTSHIKMHDPHSAQISCSMFKNMCKYMTGESVKFDSEIRIIQSIIRHGIEKAELRDEIYVQIIRQLTNNPNHEYCLRLWILLGLVSAAFSPSKTFSKHLVAYLRNKPRKDPSITCHAQFCLDNLQAPRIYPRRLPPSPLEIQACKSLTNLTCRIHLLDGRCESLSVHPCDTALDTLTKLAQKIDLQSIEGWALYESYTPGASRYPHPAYEQKGDFERSVRSHYFMADLIAAWQDDKPGVNLSLKIAQRRIDEGNFKLTLKKKIFRGPKIRNDPVEISLLYSQAVYNVVKKDNFLVDENLALSLAGLQAQITLGNAIDLGKQANQNKKGKSVKSMKGPVKNLAHQYNVETFICQRLRHQATRSKKEWSALISHSHKQFHNVNEVFCKMRYLSMVIYHCPLYGTATFRVIYKGYRTLDQNLMLGVNAEGLVLIRSSDRALLNAYRYNDLCNESGITVYADENIIQFNVKDRSDNTTKCLSFETSENEEIAMLMMSYLPSLSVSMRGTSNGPNATLDPSFDQIAIKKKTKLKMTLEDRMRTHQEVQNARRAVVRSGKLRKPLCGEENSTGLLKHTLKRLSSSKIKVDKANRFESIYGTVSASKKAISEIPQTSSDYNLYGSLSNQTIMETDPYQTSTEVAGATAATTVDELMKPFPHRYWAYTKSPLRNSLLVIYDPDLEEAALLNFNAILTYSGLINYQTANDSNSSSCISAQDSSSIDSGIAIQQSSSNLNSKAPGGSPSSASSGDIYDVCPRKLDERELLKLAQGILDRCLKKDADILKNEFFLQLIKQTTDHPDPNSEINQRHWQLLALACSVTFPSDGKILSYLYAHLRRCSLDQVTDEGQYAQFTLKSLQGTLDTKGRRLAPSETEILSTINCRRVYARVYFLDGQFQAVEFDPCATIAEVVDQIKQKIGLKPECGGYALFQPLDDDCEQVLQPDEKVGDAIAAWEAWHKAKQAKSEQQAQNQQQVPQNNGSKAPSKTSLTPLTTSTRNRSHRFVFKKYMFLDSLIDLNDPIERELLYYQTVASIREDKFPVLEQEATILCALKAQIEIGDYTKLANLPREHIRMIYKQVIMSLMPPHAFNNLPIPAIAQQHQAFRDLSCAETKQYFFNLIQSFGRANFLNTPGYILLHRAHVYNATQTFATAWPSDIWIVINQVGLHMLVTKSRVSSCPKFRTSY